MDTSTNKFRGWLDRMRGRRLTTTFALLATLSAGILVGSVITRGVSGKEQAPDTSEAKPLVVPAVSTLSNGFSKIAGGSCYNGCFHFIKILFYPPNFGIILTGMLYNVFVFRTG